jgi:serine/threonine protein kinase
MLGDELSSLRPLGQGAYAKVRLVKHKYTGELLAIKTVKLRDGHFLNEETEQIEIECRTHKGLSHSNIIKMHDYTKGGNFVELLLEYADLGDCSKLLREKKKLSEQEALGIVYQTAKGLEYIHSCGIIHRDIKLENILRCSDGHYKICDFGWCSPASDTKRNVRCGTYEYMAPEVAGGRSYSSKVDLWSLGVLAFELVHGTTPFRAPTGERIIANINSGEVDIDHMVTPAYRSVIDGLLQSDPNKRHSAKQLLALPLFRDIGRQYENMIVQKSRQDRQLYAQISREWEENQGGFFSQPVSKEGQSQPERPIDKLLRKFDMLEQEKQYNLQPENMMTQVSSNRMWSASEYNRSKLGLSYTPVISAKPNPDDNRVLPLQFRIDVDEIGNRYHEKRSEYRLMDKTGYLEINPDINQSHMLQSISQPELAHVEDVAAPRSTGLLDMLLGYVQEWAESFGREDPTTKTGGEEEIKARAIYPPPAPWSNSVQGRSTRASLTHGLPQHGAGMKRQTTQKYVILPSASSGGQSQEDFEYL